MKKVHGGQSLLRRASGWLLFYPLFDQPFGDVFAANQGQIAQTGPEK